MGNIKIANEIRFVEVQIFPPQDEIYYCLLKNGNPTQYIFSEKFLYDVLLKCYD